MNDRDFRKIILEQRDQSSPVENWEGTLLEYLIKVQENPEIADFAPNRMYKTVMAAGTEPYDKKYKTQGYDDLTKYNFFDGKIFGTREAIHDIMRFLTAAARRTETGKRILLLMGPVSSGKSTIATAFKKGLERYDTPLYTIKGCQLHEEPLLAIPEEIRPYWGDKLNVKISGHLCRRCAHMIDNETINGKFIEDDPDSALKYKTEDGKILWEKIEVEQIKISEQERIGIGTFQPSDPKSQDISELIGRVNMGKLDRYKENDPRAYELDGELQVANRGVIEYIEILKADIKFHGVLISVAQEQLIKSPGFPHMSIDTVILSHTNEHEFDKFRANKENEALHDRTYLVKVPWNLRVADEIKIYRKMIDESDFRDVHIAPWALKVAAEFAVLSRLTKSTKCSNLVQKMKLYNGEVTDEFKRSDIDVRFLLEEGRKNDEGMTGISPRFIINAMNVAIGGKEGKGVFKDAEGKTYKGCVNPIDLIRALKQNFEHHVGIKDEDIKKYNTLLTGDKQSVAAEYKEYAKKIVNLAFLHAYKDQAQELFNRYMENVSAFCKKEKVQDSITGEYSEPEEKLMRSIEDLVAGNGVPENSKGEFRNGIFVHKAACLERGKPFKYDSYPPIKEAIQTKLMSDLKHVVNLSIATSTNTNPKAKRNRNEAMKRLLREGYCDSCGNILLQFVGEIMRKQ